jgi:hypothetical protein
LIAHDFVSQQSRIPISATSFTFPSETSIPYTFFSPVFEYKSAIISSAFSPALSAITLGIISNACPNLSIAY